MDKGGKCCPCLKGGGRDGSAGGHNPNSEVAKYVMEGGDGFAPMEAASLSFQVDFDEEEEGSMAGADAASRSGTLTDDDMTFDPEGASASAAVASRFADPIAPLPQRTPSSSSGAPSRGYMPGVATPGGRAASGSFGARPSPARSPARWPRRRLLLPARRQRPRRLHPRLRRTERRAARRRQRRLGLGHQLGVRLEDGVAAARSIGSAQLAARRARRRPPLSRPRRARSLATLTQTLVTSAMGMGTRAAASTRRRRRVADPGAGATRAHAERGGRRTAPNGRVRGRLGLWRG